MESFLDNIAGLLFGISEQSNLFQELPFGSSKAELKRRFELLLVGAQDGFSQWIITRNKTKTLEYLYVINSLAQRDKWTKSFGNGHDFECERYTVKIRTESPQKRHGDQSLRYVNETGKLQILIYIVPECIEKYFETQDTGSIPTYIINGITIGNVFIMV